eukprot:94485-Alexandrium_andersonii.AAC.1
MCIRDRPAPPPKPPPAHLLDPPAPKEPEAPAAPAPAPPAPISPPPRRQLARPPAGPVSDILGT